MRRIDRLALVLGLAMSTGVALGQEPAVPSPSLQPPAESSPQAGASVLEYVERLPASDARPLVFQNREIVTLRAKILGRMPEDRVRLAVERLNRAIELGGEHRFDLGTIETASVIRLNGEPIVAVAPEDLELLTTETVTGVAEHALERLQVAFAEAEELRTPQLMLLAAARAGLATLAFLAVLGVLMRVYGRVHRPLAQAASDRLAGTTVGRGLLGNELRLDLLVRRIVLMALGAISLAATYVWLAFVLRQFPYTRPWGEALGRSLADFLLWAGRSMIDALPGLMTVALVVVLARFATRLARWFFDAVSERRIRIPGFDAEAARPTRKLVVGTLWVFAVIFAYPFLPGSGTAAFQGVSVFLGVMVSLGSTGLVAQAMNGLILMYSSSLRPGEYVKVGDIEGTVTSLGVLSTQIRTLSRELVTVPNSVVVQREAINYSRFAREGTPIRTTLTLGYDAPWRQVEAILLQAASRTNGVRSKPAPLVLKTALSDFYVEYELIAYIDDPRTRRRILSELHSHVLDLANEHGVQIMSPHYVADPDAPIVLSRERWAPPPAGTGTAGGEEER